MSNTAGSDFPTFKSHNKQKGIVETIPESTTPLLQLEELNYIWFYQ